MIFLTKCSQVSGFFFFFYPLLCRHHTLVRLLSFLPASELYLPQAWASAKRKKNAMLSFISSFWQLANCSMTIILSNLTGHFKIPCLFYFLPKFLLISVCLFLYHIMKKHFSVCFSFWDIYIFMSLEHFPHYSSLSF